MILPGLFQICQQGSTVEGSTECSVPPYTLDWVCGIQALWAYIRRHKLQSAADPEQVQCNMRLKALLGADSIQLSSLAERLSSHLSPAPPTVFNYTVK